MSTSTRCTGRATGGWLLTGSRLLVTDGRVGDLLDFEQREPWLPRTQSPPRRRTIWLMTD